MFRRPLVTFAFDADPDDGIALCRALAPEAETIAVVLRVPVAPGMVLDNEDLRRLEKHLALAEQAIASLKGALESDGLVISGEVISGLSPRALAPSLEKLGPDVLVFGDFRSTHPDVVAGWALDSARHLGLPCAVGRANPGPIDHLVCPFDGSMTSLANLVPFLRDRCDERQRITLVALGPRDAHLAGDMASVAAITGVHARIESVSISDAVHELAPRIESSIAAAAPDLIVLSTDFARGFAPTIVRAMLLRSVPSASRPVLFVPPQGGTPIDHEGTLDAFDALSFGTARIRLERVLALGGPLPLTDQPIDLLVEGQCVARAVTSEGAVEIPDGLEGPIGLGRHVDAHDPMHALETTARVMRSPRGRLALIDSRSELATLERVRAELDRDDRTLVVVRLVADTPAAAIRERLRAAGLSSALVLDVRDLLDEGVATDVPLEVAGVRLSRAAARLRAKGAWVDAIVTADARHVRGRGFALLGADTLEGADAKARAAFLVPQVGGTRAELDLLTGSTEIEGNSVSILLENDEARRTLLGLVDQARERFHAQWYIVEDDEISKQVESALVRAGARGVAVRILVDSLYSMHDSFGATNALLARLGQSPGIEVRASHPIVGVPGILDLKRRDHRKLVIVDGLHGIISGRNLGKTYYRSFPEVQITPTSDWRELPWLDAGATLEGPVVAELDTCFREAWMGAGGASFPIRAPAPVGDTPVRFVDHHGLSDAYTLEAYLSLIDHARERLVVVNGFPLQLEVQHAMLRAVARGVRLSLLMGQVRPVYGNAVPFVGGAYRAIANELVRARVAALVDAGADVRELVLSPLPHWDPALGLVRPYVHAKVLCADRRAVAIGSANLDVTAGYWESEALVIVHDERVGNALDQRLDAWLASAEPIDPHDPAWRGRADLRAILGRFWPSVIG